VAVNYSNIHRLFSCFCASVIVLSPDYLHVPLSFVTKSIDKQETHHCDFLLVINSNLPSILHRFRDIASERSTRNSSGDEIANVNFLYADIVHVLQNTIDSCINSATDRRGYVLERMCLPNSVK